MDKFYYVIVVAVIVIVALIVTAMVVHKETAKVDFETRKIRFAAVTFTGLTIMIICSVILAMSDTDENGLGFKIFEKMLTAFSPIAGGIIGYLFSSKGSEPEAGTETEQEE